MTGTDATCGPPRGADLPDGAFVAALAGLRGMGPRRLRHMLSHHGPRGAWDVASGHGRPHASVSRSAPDEVRSSWADECRTTDPAACWELCEAHGIRVVVYGDPDYPETLLCDPLPPAALFVRGDLTALDRRRVGIVGTRNATQGGLATAAALGGDLAAAGVAVVSGLAKGVDGAAHRGVLGRAGTPVAVVGNGPDRPYPRQHERLWGEVCDRGLLLSEWPPGVGPDAFRFPLRNRILAALSEVVVVVESRERGGSLLTVAEAVERGVTVMAVPGSPRNRASAGTNQLLCEGAAPATCSDDVLVALGLDTRRRAGVRFDPRPVPSALEARVLAACRHEARTLDGIVGELGLSVTDAAMALARLERSGWLAEARGWFEVLDPWSTVPPAAS